MNELKDAIFSLKINKSSGYDDISFNVLKKCFSSLREPLKYLHNLSIEKAIFSDDLKIAKVTPIYKADHKSNLCSYLLQGNICASLLFKTSRTNNIQSFVSRGGFRAGGGRG